MGFGGRCRRVVALLAACALLAAACSSDDGDQAEPDPVVTLPDDVLGGGENGGAAGGPDDQSPSAPGRGTSTTAAGRTTTSAKSGTGTTTTRQSSTTTRLSQPADSGAHGAPGAYARTLLRPQGAERIVVEVLAQSGAEPRQTTLDKVVRVLRDASGKPVSVAGTIALPAGDGTTSDDEIRDLADRHGRAVQSTEQAVVRLLYLKGAYEPTGSVLGIAVRGDTAAVFSDAVRRTARQSLLSVSTLEDAVTTHEIGHLLGLVDLVLHTGRQDPENPGHSPNRNSVMYYAVESDLVTQVLDGPPPREFDAADRDDLAAIRNG